MLESLLYRRAEYGPDEAECTGMSLQRQFSRSHFHKALMSIGFGKTGTPAGAR